MANEDGKTGGAAPAKADAAAPTGFDIANRWLHENLAGGDLARNVECWNAVHAALPALGALIDASK